MLPFIVLPQKKEESPSEFLFFYHSKSLDSDIELKTPKTVCPHYLEV